MWSTLAVVLSMAALEVAEPQPKGDPAVDLLKTFSAALQEGDVNKLNSTISPGATIYWIEGTIAGQQNFIRYLDDQSRLYSSFQLSMGNLQPATSRTVSAVWGEGQCSWWVEGWRRTSGLRDGFRQLLRS